MISRILAQTIRWGWPFFLTGWVVLLFVTAYFAPPWAEVAQDREFAFLPEDVPSRRAEKAFAEAFPEKSSGSNIVLVLHRTEAGGDLSADLKFINDTLQPALRQIAESEGGLAYELKDVKKNDDDPFADNSDAKTPEPAQTRSIIAEILTPNTPGVGGLLVSTDERAMLVVLELTTEFLSDRNWPTIEKVEALIAQLRTDGQLPPGLDVALTGSAVIGRDHSVAQLKSVHATGILTVVLVVVLLVLIYRAPLLALIPLATVYLAVQVAINILAILGGKGYMTLFEGIQIYITILAYGAGVDYCLFLTARYKEELDRGKPPPQAIGEAVGGVWKALVASAATVIGGIGMMTFAHFGKFREAGYAIPLSLFLVLLATLTFSPSLLRLAGRWAFWPQRKQAATQPTTASPLTWRQIFQPGELERIWDRVGQALLRRPGQIWLAAIALMMPSVIVAGLCYNRVSYDLIGDLPGDASSVAGTRLLQQHFSAGIVGTASILVVDPHTDFTSPQGLAIVARLTDKLRDQKDSLGLADVRSLTEPLGITPAGQRDFFKIDVSPEQRREETERHARNYFVADMDSGRRNATRLDVTFRQGPFTPESMAALDRIEAALRSELAAEGRTDARLETTGATASVRDLATVMEGDRWRIDLLVMAAVFIILVVLLRGLIVPVYLILSVLFSYFVTLGVAYAVFWALDPHGFAGIDWKVAIFLFTILIAVGEDYNIFLMTRIHEEEKRFGPVRGVTEALDRTGPIISSCGIIMAGTFASLLAGSLAEMKQLGFALSFGVLLDTFVVRPVLVPAFLILWRSGRLSFASKRPAPVENVASERV